MERKIGFFKILTVTSLALYVAAAPAFAEDEVYTVKIGDTIYSIAQSYGVNAAELMKHNGITNPQKLQPGQKLSINNDSDPSIHKTDGGFIEYVVNKGDTLFRIALQHNIEVDTLRQANGFSSSYLLKSGEKIKIPVAGTGTRSSAVSNEGTSPGAAQNASTIEVGTSPAHADLRPTEAKDVDPQLTWPVRAKEISYMTGKLYGVVLTGEHYEPVRALTEGVVASAGPYRGFGKVVIVQMQGGYLYVYGGCERLLVKEGDKVQAGTELGNLGVDALSKKSQLFFLVYRNNAPIDPAQAPRS
ncbi:peptidoglycan-binding protein LysM [Spirochaetia bacterium]|nr:peptidoglycan-binding protein LysM [Spirochaetia bacterium]